MRHIGDLLDTNLYHIFFILNNIMDILIFASKIIFHSCFVNMQLIKNIHDMMVSKMYKL